MVTDPQSSPHETRNRMAVPLPTTCAVQTAV